MNPSMQQSLKSLQQMHADGCVVTTAEMFEQWLPKRKRNSHKGDYGKVLILAGSIGYTGAPALAANAALRSGAGLIFVGVPEAVYPIIAAKLDEPMVFPLPCDSNGVLTKQAIPEILRRLEKCDACLIGPGLGKSNHMFKIISAVLQHAKCPVIVDADGINALEGHIDVLGQASCPVILTPHDNEFKRLGGDLSEGRYLAAKALSAQSGATVLLKGHRTVIVGKDGAYLNTTGNPGMATGGSGDVLAGILLSFLGQGLPTEKAAAAAAWLHGSAGDFCAEVTGEYALTPTDIIANLSEFMK